jgi:glycosyltransferase involved in cell wall biosynthesis
MRLIYFSPISARVYAQRPHFAVQAWLDLGADSVLWVDPYPCRLPRWNDIRLIRGLDVQNTPHDDRVRILRVPALPIEPLPGCPWINRRLFWRGAWKELLDFADDPQTTIIGVGRPCALSLAALRELPHRASFYDAMDNFPEFHRGLSRRAIRFYEDAIASKVDLVLASSSYLAAKYINRGLNVKKVLNAYHMTTLPPWQPVIQRDVVLGYLGCFGSWFDWPLVVQLARRLPQARLELIGPQYVPPPGNLPSNIHIFPPCKQSEASNHLARFSAGLIPFRNNALTAGVDPIKYYEYRAAGLPVLSTSFGEMALRKAEDNVYFLDQTNDFPSLVNRALRHRDDRTTMARFRRDHDWKERFITASPFNCLLNPFAGQRAA